MPARERSGAQAVKTVTMAMTPARVASLTAVALVAASLLVACGGGSDATTTTTTTASAAGTASVLCAYSVDEFNASASVNTNSTASWSCSSTARTLAANGIPDHDTGTFPNPDNPNTISAQTVSASFTLTPTLSTTATQLGGPAGVIAFVLNGVKMDPGTGGSCNDAGDDCPLGPGGGGSWRIEALGQSSFRFGTDNNNAHVQPDGVYHYHGMPEGFITKQNKGQAMTLIGWAADGFPIYARYGYSTATNAASAIKVVTGSYRLKAAKAKAARRKGADSK